MEYIQYVTKDNDRWDLIAFWMYGSPTEYIRILEANPEYRHYFVLPAGIKLKIPVIEEIPQTEVSPPWISE